MPGWGKWCCVVVNVARCQLAHGRSAVCHIRRSPDALGARSAGCPMRWVPAAISRSHHLVTRKSAAAILRGRRGSRCASANRRWRLCEHAQDRTARSLCHFVKTWLPFANAHPGRCRNWQCVWSFFASRFAAISKSGARTSPHPLHPTPQSNENLDPIVGSKSVAGLAPCSRRNGYGAAWHPRPRCTR